MTIPDLSPAARSYIADLLDVNDDPLPEYEAAHGEVAAWLAAHRATTSPECVCVTLCDPDTACPLARRWHVHADTGACLFHPDAPTAPAANFDKGGTSRG